MSGRPGAERVYRALLGLYPARFRQEYGEQMVRTFSDWRREEVRRSGFAGFWSKVARDVAVSVPREWIGAARTRVRPAASADAHRPPYGAAALAAFTVFALYALTLAPSTGFWDAGEYITAAHVLGIPHPPGSPLFVLLAHGWESLLAPTGLSASVRINLLTAALSAAAHGLWFLVIDRALAGWTEDRLTRRLAAGAAVALSATAFTVWSQSDVSEKVYAVSLFSTALVSWLALRWRDTGRPTRRLVVIVFVIGLTATNHLMGLLVAPALLLFLLRVDARALVRPRLWLAAVPLSALAVSVNLFLPLRAAQRPILAEGDPSCASALEAAASVFTWGRSGCEALSAELTRKQYDKPSIALDPTVYPRERSPRRASLLGWQLVNYAQYFDWQWARSLAGNEPLFGGARPLLTLLFVLLGLLGARTHWRGDRQGALLLATLFLTLSIGLVLYLNFKYGYSIGPTRFPSDWHEVRERDYFFVIGFSVWGLWAGVGVAEVWRWVSTSLRTLVRRPRLVAAPIAGLALLPLLANWSWASRADDYTARDWAYNVLMSVEPYGVLFTNGDNDTFPLWYAQEVEGIRKDVTVIVTTYLGTPWYAKQIRELTTPCPDGVDPAASPSRIVCQRPFEPHKLPEPLVRLGWTRAARPPRDSVLPLTDSQIESVAAGYFVAPAPMTLRAGSIEATIAAGTTLLPPDTFVAAILQAALGRRPIHFMPGSSIVPRLGLSAYTVREGITWRIHDGAPANEGDGVTPLPETQLASVAGAAIDLPLTDTLVWQVYVRRGRILDPTQPWADPATTNIPMQYVFTNYVAAQAHAARGEAEEARRHVQRAEWWRSVIGD